MDKIYIKCRAKINLTLNILNKREDNYHNLESIFQTINLYDELYIEKTNTDDICFFCNIDTLNNKENIILKAYNKMKHKYPNITGINVRLIKKIPTQAGLGGGSTDCANFIIAMNKLFDLGMNKSSMIEIGASLGADVVPCMAGNTIIANEIGEQIAYIQDNSKYYIVLVKPNIFLSTKEMFRKYNQSKEIIQKNNTKDMIQALEQNHICGITEKLYNVFEETIKDEEEIFEYKKLLLELGAKGALMTGSGSAVFGIYKDRETAKKAYYEIQKGKEAYFCIPYRSNKFKELK